MPSLHRAASCHVLTERSELERILDRETRGVKCGDVGNLADCVLLSQQLNRKPTVGVQEETTSSLKINTALHNNPPGQRKKK